ncbi:hypothetical protein AALP_AAs58184U000100 [Arabis alpina]|uniref:Uncharacterized protein n=1 Tax=Arabis alpina TaxID=50452 RepID=A0A087G3B5_ARAAL|nr:hypothetical protein AALP_AAs58184U000100 [Arabis alpina]
MMMKFRDNDPSVYSPVTPLHKRNLHQNQDQLHHHGHQEQLQVRVHDHQDHLHDHQFRVHGHQDQVHGHHEHRIESNDSAVNSIVSSFTDPFASTQSDGSTSDLRCYPDFGNLSEQFAQDIAYYPPYQEHQSTIFQGFPKSDASNNNTFW